MTLSSLLDGRVVPTVNGVRLAHQPGMIAASVRRGATAWAGAVVLLATLPFLAMVAIAIKLDSEGPVLRMRGRPGPDGAAGQIAFRTTHVANSSPTRVGGVLRLLGLDALPQAIAGLLLATRR